MKNLYESPELVLELFLCEDVMTVSIGDNDVDDPWE